jgi:ATP-binding cassette subfamily B protein RaxB
MCHSRKRIEHVSVFCFLVALLLIGIHSVDRPLSGKRLHDDGVIFQKGSGDCGVAALAMFLRYHGKVVVYDSLSVQVNLSKEGTDFYQMRQAALAYGVPVQAISMDIQQCHDLPRYVPLVAHLRTHHFVFIESSDSLGNLTVIDPKAGRMSVPVSAFVKYSTSRFLTGYCPE